MQASTNIGNKTPEKSYERSNQPKLLEYAEQNRQEGFFNDVTIQTENQSFSANRMILSCCSRYFERMFTTNMKERYQPSVEVESVDADSMRDLIEYIYTGKITINSEKVCRILSAADYLQIDDVKELCFDYLQKALSHENCFTLLAIADRYRNPTFKNLCEAFIADNFNEVLLSNGFKQCSKQDLIDLISKLRESQVEETLIYRSIVGWTKYDEHRAPGFYDLLKLINFDELPSHVMEDEVCDEELLTINLDCWKLFNQEMKRFIRRTHTRESGGRIVSIGGGSTGLKTIEVHNIYNEPFPTFPDLPQGRCIGCAVKMHDSIYFIGGMKPCEDPAFKTVWSMNLKDKTYKWKKESSLKVERMVMGAAVFNECVVVVGGATGNKSYNLLSSCSAFSPFSRSWKNIPSLNEDRSGHAVVSCKGYLYALGGYNSNDGYLSSVERMFAFEKWENVKSMQTPRRWFSAVNCNDVVYAIGGHTGDENDTTLKSVEKFDPAADEWIYVSDMNFAKWGLSACVLQGKIFVVGGLNEKNEVVKEMECYDPVADKWSIVGITDEELWGHSLVVI